MRAPKPTTVDFETHKIEGRPAYPPKPVGVSIKRWGKKPRYYAWAHASDNNCTEAQAKAALNEIWDDPEGLLFQNGRFDIDVAEVHLGLKLPAWNRVHDTMLLLFLDNPHRRALGLKECAAELLGMPPEERDAVADWLVANQPVDGARITAAKTGKHPAGAYIAYAPGNSVVGPYANGDTIRAEAIFKKLWSSIVGRGMLKAYDRERRLSPILLDMERRGVRVDVKRLADDVVMYHGWLGKIDVWLRKRLNVPVTMNLNSDAQLLEALQDRGVIDMSLVGLTGKGNYKTDKATLAVAVTDKLLAAVLKYRTQLGTCLGTFMEPWLATARMSGGLIFTTWNAVRSPGGGARTGRFSSSPNFQNMPKEFEIIFMIVGDPETKHLPKCPWKDLPALPLCRGYIIPYQKDHVLGGRDYCFSPDTEILTQNDGFVRFDKLTKGVPVAQWHHGEIIYGVPTAYQKVQSYGSLTRIVGDRSCDLLVTPTHNCLLQNSRGQFVSVSSVNYPRRHKQLHAGIYLGVDKIPTALVKLAVALQADATVKGEDRVVWKLKKTRKREQLRAIFNELDLSYLEVPTTDNQVSVTIRASAVPGLANLICLRTKTFRAEAWRRAHFEARQIFIRELGFWDGRQSGKSAWSYFTTHEANAELVVELAAISGFRVNHGAKQLPSGRDFYTVNLRPNATTWTDTYRLEQIPYGGLVYCVTVDTGAIIVRRNGKIMVTGQSQQEPRILAHFEDGTLKEQYLANPWIDYHDNAKDHLQRVFGRPFKRKPVKNINLGIIYGQGIGSLAEKNDETYEDTKKLRDAIFAMYPGLKDMYDDMRGRAQAKIPIRTWGGREYYCEEPMIIKGRIKTFDYKMVNVLIQGSAADCTKEAMIRYHEDPRRPANHFLILSVHDELVLSLPAAELAWGLDLLRQAMESVEFDVQILSEGAWSAVSWGSMVDYDKKGGVLPVPTDINFPKQKKRA